MKNLIGTYQFPQFEGEIIDPVMQLKHKSFDYDNNITQVFVKLSSGNTSFGVMLEAVNAQGGALAIVAAENWAESQLEQYKISGQKSMLRFSDSENNDDTNVRTENKKEKRKYKKPNWAFVYVVSLIILDIIISIC